MKRFFIPIFWKILVVFLLVFCSFPLRRETALRETSYFLYMEGGKISTDVLHEVSLIPQHYEFFRENLDNLNFSDRNNYFVTSARLGRIDIAETGFLELMKINSLKREPFLNLIHMYFLLEEYSVARETIASFAHNIPLDEFQIIFRKMEEENRTEERAMFLESITGIPQHQFYSWKELGKYFLYKNDYESAEYYFQKTLEAYPFHEESLTYMLELCIDSKRWSEVIDYGKALHLTPNGKNKAYYYIAKGYFESGNYKHAVEWLEKAPDSEKNNLEFLILWRNSLLAENPKNSLHPLRKHVKVLQKNGLKVTEDEILPTLSPHGREIMESYLR